ncbi:exonuclease domain-containing protein [Microvirga tunisiensis]|uniref:DNA-directed DNA polymerase n=1 Tax=Microvirga tunisiensis TaxID=2108360 RepID=A0A5N7MIS8_9HYPH|nr:exonuclease domain-containing protein [Microvirga tunisiensis]MPR05646.1 DNA polymerase III subunit epsilon [Microvirga tunisiensis]MPR23846.1 DNA polymerase III subunit epsilon [Microvirga tunisiensis]
MPLYHVTLDTETTGLSAEDGDRIVQIACVEMADFRLTGRTFNTLVNPEGRPITYDSYQIHRITNEDAARAPRYEEIHDQLLDFIGDSVLVIQNKRFDLSFLGAECKRIGQLFPYDAVDTIDIARERWPGQPVSLDALCRRLMIQGDTASLERTCREAGIDPKFISADRSKKHDALVDCILLAQVYATMMTERQLDFTSTKSSAPASKVFVPVNHGLPLMNLSHDDYDKHDEMLAWLAKQAS